MREYFVAERYSINKLALLCEEKNKPIIKIWEEYSDIPEATKIFFSWELAEVAAKKLNAEDPRANYQVFSIRRIR